MDIGFQDIQFFTRENVSATATVCAQIDRGSLEREVVAYLSTIPEGTAIGKLSQQCHRRSGFKLESTE